MAPNILEDEQQRRPYKGSFSSSRLCRIECLECKELAMTILPIRIADSLNRRTFIGGSDARVIMGANEAALLRLWREKRGEVEPEDLSGNLIVQLGKVTEDLNRSWYQRNTGRTVGDV